MTSTLTRCTHRNCPQAEELWNKILDLLEHPDAYQDGTWACLERRLAERLYRRHRNVCRAGER